MMGRRNPQVAAVSWRKMRARVAGRGKVNIPMHGEDAMRGAEGRRRTCKASNEDRVESNALSDDLDRAWLSRYFPTLSGRRHGQPRRASCARLPPSVLDYIVTSTRPRPCSRLHLSWPLRCSCHGTRLHSCRGNYSLASQMAPDVLLHSLQ